MIAPAKPQIVSLEQSPDVDPMGEFAHEFESEATAQLANLPQRKGLEAIRVSVLAAEQTRTAPRETAPRETAPRESAAAPIATIRFGWRNIALTALALVVLVQGGFMAYWMLTRGFTGAASDSGSVTVTSEPTGSPVTIDGAVRGVTPLTLSLPPGSHRIAVGTGAGLRSQDLTVTGGGNASMHMELTALSAAVASAGTGGLQIATEPAGARVSIDGEPRGVAPLTVSNLKVGDHVVTVRGASGQAVNRTVAVSEGAVASLIISMNAASSPAGAFASGWLTVTSSVPMQIFENGTLVGTTEMSRILLTAGAHELELVNAALGYRVNRSVQVAAGQTATLGLKPPMGTLSINALPWAEVWIDGQRAGETPIGNLSIAIGNHEVLFRHPEFGERRRTVTVGAQGPARIGVDMKTP